MKQWIDIHKKEQEGQTKVMNIFSEVTQGERMTFTIIIIKMFCMLY